MNEDRLRELALALEPRKSPNRAALDRARRLLRARRSVLEAEACPGGILRRSAALWTRRRISLGARLASLVLDSWSGLAPAVRGRAPSRLLRYTCEAGLLDVQLSRKTDGALFAQFAVESALPVTEVLLIAADGRRTRLMLDPHGVCEVALADDASSPVQVFVRADRDELFRIESPAWEA